MLVSATPGTPASGLFFPRMNRLSAYNASFQLLPEARATQERRLEAVSCKALLN